MKYFTIDELCRSHTAKAKGIDNTPSPKVRLNLIELIEELLDPIREAWGQYCDSRGWSGRGIIVSSGYRGVVLNRAVGGVKTSAHVVGWAADTVPANGRMAEYKKWLSYVFVPQHPEVMFDQIILEKSKKSEWVHIAIRNQKGVQRRRMFSLNV